MFPNTDEAILRQMLSEDISQLVIYVHKLYIQNTFFHIITNEMVSYLNMLVFWMLYEILR